MSPSEDDHYGFIDGSGQRFAVRFATRRSARNYVLTAIGDDCALQHATTPEGHERYWTTSGDYDHYLIEITAPKGNRRES